jgi:hypothetical protein
MFGEYHDHKLLRKYIVYFGKLFSGIKIEREDSAGSKFSTFEVPIAYGSKQKWFEKVFSDPDGQKKINAQIPRMAFEITSMSYHPERKLNSLNRIARISQDTNKFLTAWEPVPYNIGFQLHILCQKFDDGIQVVENILPYFTPDWTSTLDLVPELGIALDIPLVFTNIAMVDEYEGSFEDRKVLTFTLDFELRGYIFGPVKSSGVIKRVQIDAAAIAEFTTDIPRQERVVTIPGLTANGTPTTVFSNAVNPKTVSETDPWAPASQLTSYNDGLSYNPKTGEDQVPPIE